MKIESCPMCGKTPGLSEREQELLIEMRYMLALLDWGSLDGTLYQSYWRCKLLVAENEHQRQWAERKLQSLWRIDSHL